MVDMVLCILKEDYWCCYIHITEIINRDLREKRPIIIGLNIASISIASTMNWIDSRIEMAGEEGRGVEEEEEDNDN